jgi:hypothetical protein
LEIAEDSYFGDLQQAAGELSRIQAERAFNYLVQNFEFST